MGVLMLKCSITGREFSTDIHIDEVPTPDELTSYDGDHFVTYLRLLDAEEDGADWSEVARIVLKIDPDREPVQARRAWESHLARAKWMTRRGYEHLRDPQ